MKKLLTVIILSLLCYVSFAQYPNSTNLPGSPGTKSVVPGGLFVTGGYEPAIYADTTHANLSTSYISFYQGAIITTGGGDSTWMRYNNKWWLIYTHLGASAGVSSFNTRTGAVTLQSSDVTAALTFTPENVSNKTATASSSTTTYPSWLGVENYISSIPLGTDTTILPGIDLTQSLTGKIKIFNADTTIGNTKLATQGFVLRNSSGGASGWTDSSNFIFTTVDPSPVNLGHRHSDTALLNLAADINATNGNLFVQYTPFNFGKLYYNFAFPYIGRANRFMSGVQQFDSVNGDGRPNVVGLMWGYNTTSAAGQYDTAEAGFGFRTETHYIISGGDPFFEFHLPEIYTKSLGWSRPFSMYIDKITGIGFTNHRETSSEWFNKATTDTDYAILYVSNSNANHTNAGDGNFALRSSTIGTGSCSYSLISHSGTSKWTEGNSNYMELQSVDSNGNEASINIFCSRMVEDGDLFQVSPVANTYGMSSWSDNGTYVADRSFNIQFQTIPCISLGAGKTFLGQNAGVSTAQAGNARGSYYSTILEQQIKQYNLDTTFYIPANAATPVIGQVQTCVNVNGATAWKSLPNAPVIVKSNYISAQTTAQTISTYTTGTADSSYLISAGIDITALSANVVTTTVTYTDETNTSRTITLFPMGSTSATLTTGPSNYSPLSEIRVKASTTITLAVSATGVGSQTYNAWGSITKLHN